MDQITPPVTDAVPYDPEAFPLERRLDQYRRLRDKIADTEARHKAELAPLKAGRDQLDQMFTEYLGAVEKNSVTVGKLTVYLKEYPQAGLDDALAFRRHVIGSEAWDLVDWRADPVAVRGVITAEDGDGAPPPGVNYSCFVKPTLMVRK
jgi:hypothetical protein